MKFEWVFRWRGYFLVPYAVLLIALGKPTLFSYLWGIAPVFPGEALRFWGVGFIGKVSRKSMMEAPLLITAGPFAYVRHPLYLGNALIGFGGFLMAAGNVSRVSLLFLLMSYFFFYGLVYGILMGLEEKFLERKFGEIYSQYKRQVSRLIPGFTPYSNARGTFRWTVAWNSEIYTLLPLSVALILMALRVR